MGSVNENEEAWGQYDWHERGDEWSVPWGGTDAMWWGTLLPRIHHFVPAPTILEIAPGFGRWTQYLKDLCERLVLVDLAEVCIEGCRERFSASRHITYHVNDGSSLAMIEDGSVDFVFSFDSLVHAEADVMANYLEQLAHKLTPNGVGFLHHSNLGAYSRHANGGLAWYIANENNGTNWRAPSMSAELFERQCERAGLQCIAQELVAWRPRYSLVPWVRPGGPIQRVSGRVGLARATETVIDRYARIVNDCFSVFTLPGSSWARPNRVQPNKRFMEEAADVSRVGDLYSFGERT